MKKINTSLLFFISACLDLFFSRGDELYAGYPPEWQWYIFDYAGFYRILCVVGLMFFFIYHQLREQKLPMKINKIYFWLYVAYWVGSLAYYYWWIKVDQYNKRF
jgi:hypothetical protein